MSLIKSVLVIAACILPIFLALHIAGALGGTFGFILAAVLLSGNFGGNNV